MNEAATLSAFLDAVWSRLENGANGHGPGKLLTLATVNTNGGASARMLVLRAADRAGAEIELHTHAASAKIAELAAQPKATLLLWDAEAQLQARLGVLIAISEGDDDTWQEMGDGTRLNYARDPLPGQTVDAPDAVSPTPDPSLFRVLRAKVLTLDILTLATRPHRRARFHEKNAFAGEWIAP